MRYRRAQRIAAACLVAAAAGGLVLTAAPAPVRLVGVSAQATGRAAAVLIEATEPVPYAVSRPDPLTLLVDLRNVSVADAANQVSRSGPVTGVSLEQATTVDGKSLARVRVALAGPASYKVRSARNLIRVEFEPTSAPITVDPEPAQRRVDSGTPAAAATDIPAATMIEKVRATHTRTSTTVILSGNGRLNPSALNESDDQPRRLLMDFPNVSSKAPAQTGVEGVFVKRVRVLANAGDAHVTRVVLEVSPTATYHVERVGAGGRDIAVVFEGRRPGGEVMLAPSTAKPGAAEPDDTIPLPKAIANAAAMTPPDAISASSPTAPVVRPSETQPAVAPPTPQGPATLATVAQQQQQQAPPPAAPPAAPAAPGQSAQASTFSAQVPGTGEKRYQGVPVSMDFQDADLRAVLRTFAEISGLNMVIDAQVQGRVDIVLNEVPWDQALDTILRGNKLGWTVDGTIVRIAPLGVLADEQAQQQKLNEAKALAGELRVQTFTLSYAKADAMRPLLTTSALSQRGQIQVDARTNTLIVTDLADRLQTAATLIATLDKPEPQVEVEARVVQTTRDFARALGIQWGFNGQATPAIGNTLPLTFPNNGSLQGRSGTQGPTGGQQTGTVINLPATQQNSAIGLALGAINGAFNLDVALSALESSGKGRILSTPRLTTQNNKTAVVTQGVQIPIQTVANNTVTVSFKDAALSLQVTPQITAANTVIMDIQVSNDTPDFGRQVNGTPPINRQSVNTIVLVNDGATAVIGGVFVSTEAYTQDRTPMLHRVPLLGWLFRRDSLTDQSRELLIFITPRILRG